MENLDQSTVLGVVLLIFIVVMVFRDGINKLLGSIKSITSGKFSISTHEPSSNPAPPSLPISRDTISYITKNALDFYERCASVYDKANSDSLTETHREVVSKLEHFIDSQDEEVRILDLGGGTGKHIAYNCLHSKSAKVKNWTNVDFSKNMLDIFKGNLSEFEPKITTIEKDIHTISQNLFDNKFDIVILCFVVSSMPTLIDLRAIRNLIKPDGMLLLAEGDPIYTAKKQGKWSLPVANLEFTLNPINPAVFLTKAYEAGFTLEMPKSVLKFRPSEKDHINYAYIFSLIAK